MELERALAADAEQVIRVTSSAQILEGFGAVLENSPHVMLQSETKQNGTQLVMAFQSLVVTSF